MSALGSLVVSLALDYAQYTQGLDKSDQAALQFAQNAQRNFDQASNSAKEFLTDTAKNVAGAVVAFVGFDAVISRTQAAINSLESLDDAAQKTGSSVENLSRIQKTAKNFGDDFATIEQSITKLAKGLASIDDEGSQVLSALDAINVSARNADGQLRTSAEVYIDVAKSLQEYEDGAEKTALANALFGKSGAELLPMLNNLADGVDDVTAVSATSAAQAAQFNDSLARSKAMVGSLFGSLAVELLPTLNNIAQAMLTGAQSTGQFSFAGQVVAPVIKGLTIAGYAAVQTFNLLAETIGTAALQLIALTNLDFKGVASWGSQWEKTVNQSRQDFDKFVDTIMNSDKSLAQAAESGGMKKTLDFTLSMPAATEKATQATRTQVSESERFIQSLTREAENLGKTSAEIKRFEAAKLGVLDIAAPLIDKIEQENKALRAQQIQVDSITKNLQRYQQITESVLTDQEKYDRYVKVLNEAKSATDGTAISQETYNRALQNAEEQFLKTGATGKQALDEISQFSIQAQRNLQNALGDALFDGINGRFDDMVDGFVRAIQQMLAQALAADIWGALFNKPTGNMASLFSSFGLAGDSAVSGGSGGVGVLDMANLGTSALNFASTGFGTTTALSGLGGALPGEIGAFFSGMGGGTIPGVSSSAALAGSSFAAVAGPLAAAAGLTQVFKMFAGDKRMGGGFGDALNFVGDIPVLSEFIPVVPLMNALFGRGPLEQKETNLIGDFTAGGFSGITSTKFKAEGGAFISDKVDRVMTDTDSGELLNQYGELVEGGIADELEPFADQAKSYATELGQYLDDSISGISKSLRTVADSLGLGTEALDNFSMGINIASEKGEALTDEQIGQVITDAGDSMARSLIPGIDSLSRSGESALQTMERLGFEFSSLEGAAAVLSGSMSAAKDAVKGMSFEQRTELVDRAGGVDALNQQVSFFATNFLTPDEQYNFSFDLLNEELGKLGLSADMSKDQYAELIRSVTQVGGVSVETASKLLELAPTFLQVKDAAEQLNAEAKQIKLNANQNTLSLAGSLAPDEVLGIKYSMMSDALSEFGISADISREQLTEYVREFVNSGGLLTAAAESVMTAVGITLDYLNSVDLNKANADQNLLSLAETFAPEEVVNIKFGMLNDVLDELGLSANMSKEELIGLLREFVASGGLYSDIAGQVLYAAGLLDDAYNTLDQLNLTEVNDAYSALQRSVDAERTRLTDEYNTALDGINTQIETVTDSVSKLKSLSDALKTTVNDIRPMERDEAKAQIESALTTARSGGGLPDVEDISQALDVLKQQSTSGFTSSFDFAFEQAKTASMLGDLGALTDDQLSTEERALNALKDSKKSLEDGFKNEMLRLDGILEDAQAQINLLTGIETNTKDIAEALQNFQAAINAASGVGSEGGDGFSVFSFSGSGITGKPTDAEIKAFVEANINDPLKIYYKALELGLSSGDISKAIPEISIEEINATTDALGVARLPEAVTPNISASPVYGITNQMVGDFYQANKDNPLLVAQTALQYDVNVGQLSRETGYTVDEINNYFKEQGLPLLDQKGFADGGFTGTGSKYQPAGIVHAGEYVFSQAAVRNIGVGALEQLHETAKQGKPEGYATGGSVGNSTQNIINQADINRINSFTDKNIIDARSLFEERISANDAARELTKQHESTKDIASTAYVLNTLNDTNSISNINNVIDAKRIFDERNITRINEKNILNAARSSDLFAKFIDPEKSTNRITDHTLSSDSSRSTFNNEVTREFIADRVRELQHVELNRGFAGGGYTGNDGRDDPVGNVHGQEYVFSAPAVDAIGINTLDNLHQIAKKGKKPGFSDGGFVGGDIGPAPIIETTRQVTSNNNQPIQLNQDDVIAELRLLREEMKQVREYNRRMSNKFDAVTQGGTAFRTKTA